MSLLQDKLTPAQELQNRMLDFEIEEARLFNERLDVKHKEWLANAEKTGDYRGLDVTSYKRVIGIRYVLKTMTHDRNERTCTVR